MKPSRPSRPSGSLTALSPLCLVPSLCVALQCLLANATAGGECHSLTVSLTHSHSLIPLWQGLDTGSLALCFHGNPMLPWEPLLWVTLWLLSSSVQPGKGAVSQIDVGDKRNDRPGPCLLSLFSSTVHLTELGRTMQGSCSVPSPPRSLTGYKSQRRY